MIAALDSPSYGLAAERDHLQLEALSLVQVSIIFWTNPLKCRYRYLCVSILLCVVLLTKPYTKISENISSISTPDLSSLADTDVDINLLSVLRTGSPCSRMVIITQKDYGFQSFPSLVQAGVGIVYPSVLYCVLVCRVPVLRSWGISSRLDGGSIVGVISGDSRVSRPTACLRPVVWSGQLSPPLSRECRSC